MATKKKGKKALRSARAKKSARSASTRRPTVAVVRESGPRGWFLPVIESAYARLVPRGSEAAASDSATALGVGSPTAFVSRLQPGMGEGVLASPPLGFWIDRLAEYKRRKGAEAHRRRAALMVAAAGPPGPVVPGEVNWSPLGPSVVLDGQAIGSPPVAGRVSGIAVAPGGSTVYAATANGGVFRSDDSGLSWASLMDAFDVDPTQFASTSLACGAIAIDAADPQRIYVGTGEGDTHSLFQRRITHALPAYRGIGPIRSDDGGGTWRLEPTAAASPPLGGAAFFALAVSPGNRDSVVGATTVGLYQRVPAVGGTSEWALRRPGVHSSVVVASAGATTRFFAAEWGQGVVSSADGTTWTPAGSGFPTANVGRIALAVQPTDPNRVYAMVADTNGALLGVYRLDGMASAWVPISNPPDVLPTDNGRSQGDYDLAIAVDPVDPDTLYLGGSYFNASPWPGSIWRCKVTTTAGGLRMVGTSIGVHAHADIHVLVHSPGDSTALWTGCDGGVFLNRDPRGSGKFDARNNGLSCLCSNFIGQHPTDPSVLFTGLQDNGTARTAGGPIWKHVNSGDGGYCLVNWANPMEVLIFANGVVYRALDGGVDDSSWTHRQFADWEMMTEPIVGTPYDPQNPNSAKRVAMAAGRTVWFSENFGDTWPTANKVTFPSVGGVFALVFASPSRAFAGTTAGEVYRLDRSGPSWTSTRIDNAVAGPLGLNGIISDIAVDWADASRASVYVAFGGVGDFRHVWRFNGTRWEPRSGTGPDILLDVEHNAIVVDREAPANIYVGADIGVWRSPDGGVTWAPLPNGLPDAPIFDLQIHPTRRLLRAATHGRGVYEYPL